VTGCLLPVGTPGGICSGLAQIPDGSGLVRLGEDLVHLDEAVYRMWRACGAAPRADELIEWANAERLPQPQDGIRELLEAELAIEHDRDHIGSLAVRLTGECLGNGTGRDGRFRVLGRDGALVEIDPCSFEALLRCDGVTTIATLCGELEASQPEPSSNPQPRSNPEARSNIYREALSAGLPMLVRAGIVRLDRGRTS
jgi:hypothetical protein